MSEETGPEQRPRRKPPSIEDVFGDVLPDVTRDERAPETGASDSEAWYRENRPPHHEDHT